MKTVLGLLRSFKDSHTYDVRTNAHLWLGLLLGAPIPVFLLILADESSLSRFLQSTGMRIVFLLHPLLFALVFGAFGTVRLKLLRENEQLIQELRELAWFDPLTGLYNRRYVMEEFGNILRREIRSGAPVHAILFDLDGFTPVKDRLARLDGHEILQT